MAPLGSDCSHVQCQDRMKPEGCDIRARGLYVGGMRWVVALVIGMVVLGAPTATNAQVVIEEGLDWDDEWRTVEPWDWVTAGVLSVGTLTIALTAETDEGRWVRGNALDDAVHRGLHARTERGRRVASILSDVTRSLVIAPAVFVDLGLAGRENPTVAVRLAGASILSFATSTFLMTGAKYLFRRERPLGRRCDEDVEDDDCESGSRYRSFFSGHAATAFTAASLTCTYHQRLPLYGSRAGDIAACATAMGFATMTSLLRVVAEKHHFSDVVVGALVGFLSGFLLPTSLYFGFRR